MIGILQCGLSAHGQRLVNPLADALARDLHGARNACDRFTGVITAQYPRTLRLSHGRSARLAQLL
jgi:hypothetical protein